MRAEANALPGDSMKAVIPAAGLGTRFLPATNEQPKEMRPVVDRPAIHWILRLAALASVTFEMIFMRKRLDWQHTPKVRVD